jgi:type II secretory pathway component HofQ
MELSMEQSERDFSSQVEVAGHVIPGIKTRGVSTQVLAKLGETYFLRNPEYQGEVSFWLIQVEKAEPLRK